MESRIPQSVAKLVVFKAFLASDHVTAATGKTIAMQVSQNGGAFANFDGGALNATEIANGWYKAQLETADADTKGPLIVRGTEGTIDPAEVVYEVVNATNAGFTSLPAVVAGAALGVPLKDANSFLDVANMPAVAAGGANGLFIAGTNAATTITTSLTTGAITLTTPIVSDMTHIHGTALTETATQLAGAFSVMFDVAAPVLTAESVDQTGDAFAAIGTVPALDGAAQTVGAAIAKIADDNGGADFDAGTDSLQEIRDRGDAAWTTGAGGSDRLLMVDTTIATLDTQTSFTLTAGSADDNAYRNCTAVIEDVSTATQKAIGLISAYTGATKTVTLKYDPAVFTMAATDKIYILAENALKSSAANRQIDIDTNGRTDVGEWLGTACATPTTAGVPETDVTYWRGEAVPATNDTGIPLVDVNYWYGTEIAGVTNAGSPDVTLAYLGTSAQSVADLKDFADVGYDPSTNQITGIVAAGRNEIADATLIRGMSNVEASADPHSLCTIVLAGLESSVAGTTWTIRKTGGTTYLTKTIAVDAAADPIVSVT